MNPVYSEHLEFLVASSSYYTCSCYLLLARRGSKLAIATKIGMEMKLQVENWMVRPPVRWLLDRAG